MNFLTLCVGVLVLSFLTHRCFYNTAPSQTVCAFRFPRIKRKNTNFVSHSRSLDIKYRSTCHVRRSRIRRGQKHDKRISFDIHVLLRMNSLEKFTQIPTNINLDVDVGHYECKFPVISINRVIFKSYEPDYSRDLCLFFPFHNFLSTLFLCNFQKIAPKAMKSSIIASLGNITTYLPMLTCSHAIVKSTQQFQSD